MEHPLPTCDMCGKEIPYETTHVSFIKNTETLHLIDDCIEEVEVIDSELISYFAVHVARTSILALLRS